jgi:pimeloyl-ACP methyl ester carboxylesterase/uncharacterized protein (DUF362 family)
VSDPIVREFELQLRELANEFAGRPRAELDALWAIGIEREAIVTVAYRRSVIEARLSRMPIDAETRAVVSRAIRWAWRDEEGHTIWVRGALVRRPERIERARAFRAQLEGWIGGWVSSRQNHLGWRDAPVQRLVAEGIEAVGVATGRIPSAVRDALHWNTFADFCRFNRSAETTAALAWLRMAELAAMPEIAASDEARGFLRMAADEDRHARIFAVLSESFDDRDRATVSAAALRSKVLEVGQRFVALPDAGQPARRNPLGKGARVFVREGREGLVGEVLDALGIEALLEVGGRPPVVALKTTFMLVAHKADPSPGVSMSVLREAIAWFRAHGAVVRVIDARNYYEIFHGGRSVAEVAAYLGLAHEVIDAGDEQVEHPYPRGMGLDTISKTWRDADVRVVLGKLRSHPTATALLSLEAAEGLGARVDDHLFADRRAERETAVLMALDALPPHAALLDASENVPDGLMGILGTDRPLAPGRIYGSTDAVALDAVACRHLGADPEREGTLLAHAFDWFGDPRSGTEVDGVDAPIAGFRLPDHSGRTALLAALALPVFTHASRRGELFLPEFDERAFPPAAPKSRVIDRARAIVRRIVADRAPEPNGSLLPTAFVGSVRVARLGRGAPIVLLHGYPETLQLWSSVAPMLAARGREAIAFDWPGLGFSAPAFGAADPFALADALGSMLDAAKLERVDLVAADMGGPPALVFAARHPDRVGRVVITSSLLFGDEATSIEISVMRRAGLASAAFRLAPAIVYARCKETFLPSGEALPDALDADFSVAFHRPEVRERLTRMCADYERAFSRLPDEYWKIRTPVRLLWAEHDGHFPPRQAERLAELVPSASVEVVRDARHWMPISRPREVADRIAAFMDGS